MDMETVGWAVVLIITAIGATCTTVNVVLELRERLHRLNTVASAHVSESDKEPRDEHVIERRDDSLALEALTNELQDAIFRSAKLRAEIKGLMVKIALAKRQGARTDLN